MYITIVQGLCSRHYDIFSKKMQIFSMEIFCGFFLFLWFLWFFFIKSEKRLIGNFFFIEVSSNIDHTLTYIRLNISNNWPNFIKYFENIHETCSDNIFRHGKAAFTILILRSFGIEIMCFEKLCISMEYIANELISTSCWFI